MNYLDYFTRGERRLDADQLKQYKESIRTPSSNAEDIKLYNLYRDSFGPHVTDYFGGPRDDLHLSRQVDRIISADNLTNVFLNSQYEAPRVVRSLGSRPEPGDGVSLTDFRQRVTTNEIDVTSSTNYELGTNKLTYLVGDVGVGKSTFISRVLMDYADEPQVDDNGYRIVPILYNFEVRHRDGAKLKRIDESFWADLYSLIYRAIAGDRDLAKTGVPDEIAINPVAPGGGYHRELIHHIKQLIHHLAVRKIRLFLIFDNLDRYHFHYTKYSFFEDYAEEQFESVKANISALVNMFDKKDLWTSGLCVLFVCRRYLYDYLVNNFDDVAPKDNHFAVFQLPEVTARAVVAPRLKLFERAIQVVDSVVRSAKSAAFRDYLEHLKGVLIIEDAAIHHGEQDTPALEALSKLGHNGYRSLVNFLASLPLRHKDADAVNRLLVTDPHLLLLLYIANNRQRYTQDQLHFPNLFLSDALVAPNRDFPHAHKPHVHTYWLKYLILKYLAVREEEKEYCTGADVLSVFAGVGRYEKHLVQLVLGSLCTTGEFSCVDIDYSTTTLIADCRLALTARGRYLVGHDSRLFGGTPVDFCFNFHYLQMMVDDKLLALPKNWVSKFYSSSTYSYLYLPDFEYNAIAGRFVLSKIEGVLYFLRILEACYDFEREGRGELFEELGARKVAPDFRRISHGVLDAASRLLTRLNRHHEYARIEELEQTLRYDPRFEEFFAAVPDLCRVIQK